ncbi:MAG: type IV toxin-antitoxin system AbiEi family antitoxin domain-containing protein [Candidatus Cloacimonetes bacterium]|nr:type IV toxin-antitoxin system AbiEi family antitoxin domain-containing protein [Candidatus Cloacimonadota bacterium]
MNSLEEYFIANKGYAVMKDLKNNSFHTRAISKAVENGIIEKVKPGLYKLIDYDWDENNSFVDICKAKRDAVICLSSAMQYYNLSTINPQLITVAVPANTDKFKLKYPPIKIYYFSKILFPVEIEQVDTEQGEFKIYSLEKTICDAFRYRNKIGEDIALEALKNYLLRKNSNLSKLHKIAKQCKVNSILEPYIKVLVVN